MNEFVEYAISVVVIPAVVATVAAVPVLVGPLRRRPALVEGAVAVAVAAAFLLSFARELDANAIVRQFVAIPDYTQAVERWHRLAFAAIVLGIAAPVVAAMRARVPRGVERVVTVLATVLAALSAGLLVEFPRATVGTQLWQGALCALATLGYARFSQQAAIWAAWIAFAVLSVLALEGGFASLAVMAGALSAASFGIGVAGFAGARLTREAAPVAASGALALVLGVLTALVARCGQAYDQQALPIWAWTVAPLLPFAGLAFGDLAKRAPSRSATTFWRALGTVLLAAALLAAFAVARSAGDEAADDAGGDPMDGIYG